MPHWSEQDQTSNIGGLCPSLQGFNYEQPGSRYDQKRSYFIWFAGWNIGVSSRVYHIGFVVPDIDAAIASMSEVLGVTFLPPVVFPYDQVETPDGPRSVQLKYSYSTRPCHVELIQADPESMFAFDHHERCYHLGVWAENMEAEMKRLEDLGMPAVWWGRNPNGQISFSYHRTPFGFFIELVDGEFRQFYRNQFSETDPVLGVNSP